MAHGYAKIAGKPIATMVHGVVGTQHAAMAIYNAYCDQTPMLVLAGNVGQARSAVRASNGRTARMTRRPSSATT